MCLQYIDRAERRGVMFAPQSKRRLSCMRFFASLRMTSSQFNLLSYYPHYQIYLKESFRRDGGKHFTRL